MPKIVFNEADVGIEREGLEVFEQESYGHSLQQDIYQSQLKLEDS